MLASLAAMEAELFELVDAADATNAADAVGVAEVAGVAALAGVAAFDSVVEVAEEVVDASKGALAS